MNVSLTPELERLVEQKVQSGRYQNNSEVIRTALRKLFDEEAEQEQRLALLEAEVQKGLQSIKEGRVVSADEVWQRIMGGRRKP